MRLGALGVIASVQPLFATSDMNWAPTRLGPDRLEDAYAWKSLQEDGARLAFGSDAPVEPIDPLRGFHAAFWGDEIGSITPGKRADFVVLSQNVMVVPSSHLLDTDVVATYIDGTLVHAQDDWPDV